MEMGLSIVALVISILSGTFSLYTFLWTAKRDRKQATLEAYNRLQAEVFDYSNTYRPAEICDICTDKKYENIKLSAAIWLELSIFAWVSIRESMIKTHSLRCLTDILTDISSEKELNQ